jgi:hypothetical protein
MEFIEWLGLAAVTAAGCFFFVFLFWRAFARKPRGAMSRGRIVWLLLGGLSVILYASFVEFLPWRDGEPPGDFLLKFGPFLFIAWGVAEITIALRAAFARKRA